MIKSFFYSSGKFQPIYAWITIFCLLIAVGIVLRFFSIGKLSDGLILGMMGFIELLILLYNTNKKRSDQTKLNKKQLDIKNSTSKL